MSWKRWEAAQDGNVGASHRVGKKKKTSLSCNEELVKRGSQELTLLGKIFSPVL